MKLVEFDNYEKFHASKVPGKCEVVVIIRDCGDKTASAHLLTECKSRKTALRRFFKALEGDSRFDGCHADVDDYGGRFYIELPANA